MDSSLANVLIGLERSLLTPEVRDSAEMLEGLLAPDFVEFGASGRRFSRADVVADLASGEAVSYSVDGFECVELAPGLVQLRYLSEARSASGLRRARRSSFWRQDATGWRMTFHQGTVIPDSQLAG